MNEDSKMNSEKVPETKDETKKDELNMEELDEIAGGVCMPNPF